MNPDFSPELRPELLDDFYAECDELLTNIRTGLIQLEEMLGNPFPDPTVIEALFRHVHSLKGISAIAGLRPAEQLAHGMEDILRAVSKRLMPPTHENVDALLEAAQRLEQIATEHRLQKPLPEIADVLERLQTLSPSATNGATTEMTEPAPPKIDPLKSARERGLNLWTATFVPAPGLDQRGVNLKSVRERLIAIGEVISATPSVRGKGSIVFEFVLGLRGTLENLPAWENDGVRFGSLPAGPSPVEESKIKVAPEESSGAESLTPSHIVRVDLARLDDLMRITGEMVINRSRLEERISQNGAMGAGLKDINLALARSLREMREAVARVRMVPIAEIFNRMPFVVRDLARASEKKARVVLEGHLTEVDKYLVERL
ncbi:MAG: Hpt domain-containing protein, partial [Opitutaceae bacterium]